MREVLLTENCVYFRTEYNIDFIRKVKEIGGRWDKERKYWIVKIDDTVLLSKGVAGCIKRLGAVLGFFDEDKIKKVIDWLESRYNQLKRIQEFSPVSVSVRIPPNKSLYRFQEEGVVEAIKRGGRVLLADEMGLGKTVQAIVYLNTVDDTLPAVVVCPAVVKLNWQREILNWMTRWVTIDVLYGRNGKIGNADIYIVNYDIVENYIDFFIQRGVKTIILDECHYIKNWKAKRTKAIQRLVKDANPKHIMCLSGTPLLNRPIELWTTLNMLKPEIFRSFWQYAKRYCGAWLSEWGWQFNGATHIDELAGLLRDTVMIRREKKDVLKDLPSKIRSIIPLSVEAGKDLKDLEKLVKDVVERVETIRKEIETGNLDKEEIKKKRKLLRAVWEGNLATIEKYRQMAAVAKLPFIFEFIESCLEQGESVVVFVHHRDIWKQVMERFKDVAVGVLGGDDVKARDSAVMKFQNGEAKVFVGSIRATGEGVTLNKASKVVFVEYDWTPARMVQCEDRLHRIGQKQVVNSYWFVLEGSVDEYFVGQIIKKMDIVDRVLKDQSEEVFLFI